MCEPVSATALGLMAGGTVLRAVGEAQRGKLQQALLERRAGIAELEAGDATRRGELDVQRVQLAGRELEGAQRTALAASNVDLSSGTPAALVADTAAFTELDVAIVRANAAREAWSKRVEAEELRFQGRAARRAGVAASGATLLSGAADFAGAAYRG